MVYRTSGDTKQGQTGAYHRESDRKCHPLCQELSEPPTLAETSRAAREGQKEKVIPKSIFRVPATDVGVRKNGEVIKPL
jgi:hypothetical protein